MIGTSPCSVSTTGISGPVIFLTCLTIGVRNSLMNLPASRLRPSKLTSSESKSSPSLGVASKPQ